MSGSGKLTNYQGFNEIVDLGEEPMATILLNQYISYLHSKHLFLSLFLRAQLLIFRVEFPMPCLLTL